MKTRLMVVALLTAAIGLAQRPWWDREMVQNLNLSPNQQQQIRMTQRDYRAKLLEARAAVQRAENELEAAFNEQNVDSNRANQAIENLANSRANLTRALSQMSLRMRMALSPEQWRELQRRQANRMPRRLE